MTAKETQEDHDGGQARDANSSDNSDQDETFELVDVGEVRETGKKARKGKKKVSSKEKKSEKKGKKLKRVGKGDEDMVKTKEKIKRKKKTVASKRNTDEVSDVKMKTAVGEEDGVKRKGKKKRLQKESTDGGPEKEPERKKKKRKSSEEMNEVSKRNKKAKMLLSSGIEDVQKETGEDMTFGNDEQLLIEGDGIQENEPFQTQDTEVIDSKVTVADGNKSTLNPKNVFQIEDLGKENDLLNYADCDSDEETRAHRMTIQEAFANDDVIEEFVKEKENTAEASKPKEVDLSLPGWGDWGGPGIDETKRKKKFKVPSKPTRARKDTKLAHVIINEDRDKKFAKNQVITRPTLYILHTAQHLFTTVACNCRKLLKHALKRLQRTFYC